MEDTKVHWKKQFNYDFMGSYSLPDGKDVVLTIKETKKDKVANTTGKKEECFVVYFKESDKPMILNRTNCKTLEKIFKTPFIDEWIGKKVQLGIDTVSAFGESVEALRIRPILPKDKVKVELTPTHAKWSEALAYIAKGGKIEGLLGSYTISEENQAKLTAPKPEEATK